MSIYKHIFKEKCRFGCLFVHNYIIHTNLHFNFELVEILHTCPLKHEWYGVANNVYIQGKCSNLLKNSLIKNRYMYNKLGNLTKALVFSMAELFEHNLLRTKIEVKSLPEITKKLFPLPYMKPFSLFVNRDQRRKLQLI